LRCRALFLREETRGLIPLGLVLGGGILFPTFGFHWIAF
jgi:hypothetical protein